MNRETHVGTVSVVDHTYDVRYHLDAPWRRGTLYTLLPQDLLEIAGAGTALLETPNDWVEIGGFELTLGTLGDTPSVSFVFTSTSPVHPSHFQSSPA